MLAASFVLTFGPACAQPVSDWSGFRAGLLAGVGFGSHTDSHSGLPAGPSANGDYSLGRSMGGWQAGATAGYFWQQGALVEGVELDAAASNVGGAMRIGGVARRDGSGANPANFLAMREHVDTMIDVRATIGFAVSRHFLPYLTGGWMYHHGRYGGQFQDATPNDFVVLDGAGRSGWTLGAGIACQFRRDWVFKVDYLYYNVGNHAALSNTIGGLQSAFAFEGTGGLLRLALTYRVP